MLLGCCISVHSYGQQAGTVATLNDTAASVPCNCNCSTSPLGIMTGHVHGRGEWMLAYTYQDTRMQGNRSGTTKISDNDVYSRYTMAPEKMSMQMHMLMGMYSITDRLSLMATTGFTISNMSMNMAAMSMPISPPFARPLSTPA